MSSGENPDAVLAVRGLSKSFSEGRVLDNFEFDLGPGEIHGLVGMNGSGKSTFIKVLAGYHSPDPGSSIRIANVEVDVADTQIAHDLGLRFVHQDLGLVEDMSAVENLFLGVGYPRRRGMLIDWRRARRETEQRLDALGFDFNVMSRVRDVSAAQRTGIAIARALLDDDKAKVLVLDEPTASLNTAESEVLFTAMSRLRQAGVGLIFVSHHLEEVFDSCDRVTILRDGCKVATSAVADLDRDAMVQAMTGAIASISVDDRVAASGGEPVLEVAGLCGETVDNLSLFAPAGRVVGIAGLTGSGRDEVLSLLFGSRPRHGDVTVSGRGVRAGAPHRAIAAGMALVPADRHADGSIGSMSVQENCTLANLASVSGPLGSVSTTRERHQVEEWIDKLGIHPPSPEAVFSTLSGGNQQKVVLARWLRADPRVLLLDEPTQGVDVRAKATIHRLVRKAAETGVAVVVASSDDRELCEICDEVLVMVDGKVEQTLAGPRLTLENLTRAQLRGPTQRDDSVA